MRKLRPRKKGNIQAHRESVTYRLFSSLFSLGLYHVSIQLAFVALGSTAGPFEPHEKDHGREEVEFFPSSEGQIESLSGDSPLTTLPG